MMNALTLQIAPSRQKGPPLLINSPTFPLFHNFGRFAQALSFFVEIG